MLVAVVVVVVAVVVVVSIQHFLDRRQEVDASTAVDLS